MIEKIKKFSSIVSKSAPHLNIVYNQASSIFLASLIGYFIDIWLSTDFIFTLFGLITGLVISFYILAKTIWNK